jgi:hypothetical protein
MGETKRVGSSATEAPAAPRDVVQEALQVTWVLKGHLKNARISYIRVARLLAEVRDKQLYAALRHADIQSYAEERLQLRRSALYRYLQVYDWITEFHAEWLRPKPKGFIPELSDVGDLMWIDRELTKTNLAPKTRAELEALRKKALDGRLRAGELAAFRSRRQGSPGDKGLRRHIARFRFLRMRLAAAVGVPPEALAHMDAALAILQNAQAAGSGPRDTDRSAPAPA